MNASKQSKLPIYVENKTRRINIKSKRRKNIFKKSMELKNLCDLDILIIIKDKEFNKV